MYNYIILTDTRQQKERHITKEFDKQNILHIQTKLDSADYMAVRYDQLKGYYKDYSILIDTKKDLLEVCNNICNSSEHSRVVREIELAQSLGCESFYFLIGENNIKTTDDIKKWRSRYTKITGERLLKTIKTFSEHHNCKFIICPKKEMGAKIISLLDKKSK